MGQNFCGDTVLHYMNESRSTRMHILNDIAKFNDVFKFFHAIIAQKEEKIFGENSVSHMFIKGELKV